MLCAGDAELDPLPHVIRGIKARAHLALHRRGPGAVPSRLDKYDLVQQVLGSDAPAGQSLSAGLVSCMAVALSTQWCKHPLASDLPAVWQPLETKLRQGSCCGLYASH